MNQKAINENIIIIKNQEGLGLKIRGWGPVSCLFAVMILIAALWGLLAGAVSKIKTLIVEVLQGGK